MKYFDVYVLCQAASRLLDGDFARTVNDFFEPLFEDYDDQNQFTKFSILHRYCEWIVRMNIWDSEEAMIKPVREAYELKEYVSSVGTLWIDQALNYYHDTKYDFLLWLEQESGKTVNQLSDTELYDLLYDYLFYLQEEEMYYECLKRISNEMFYILFQNRAFLYSFNHFLSIYNQNKKIRITLPYWARRAVFYRDRGICVFCGKDLSGNLHISEDREIQYDHIVSLASNGVNDISNIQLSCRHCNEKKSASNTTSVFYQQWYDLDT